MTQAFYPKALRSLQKADIDMDGAIKIALLDTGTGGVGYDAAHEFLSDIAAGVQASTSALTGKDFTGGVFSSDDASAVAVSGDSIEALVFYRDSGDPATSRLIYFTDEDIDGFPATPDGGNFSIACPTAGWWTL